MELLSVVRHRMHRYMHEVENLSNQAQDFSLHPSHFASPLFLCLRAL